MTSSCPESSGFECLDCGQSLDLVPESAPLQLQCPNGDLFTLDEVLRKTLPRGLVQLRSDRKKWQARSRHLLQQAGRALICGHPTSAADLSDAAERIEKRIAVLERLLPA